MNYTESLAYLDSLGKFGIKLGMEDFCGSWETRRKRLKQCM